MTSITNNAFDAEMLATVANENMKLGECLEIRLQVKQEMALLRCYDNSDVIVILIVI